MFDTNVSSVVIIVGRKGVILKAHPIKTLSKAKKLTYRDISDAVRAANAGEGPSAQLIAQYVGGFKRPSPRYADMIHIAYPEIGREDLLYFPSNNAA